MTSQKVVYKSCLWLITLALIVGCVPIQPAPAPSAADAPVAGHTHELSETLGTVDFPVSCNAAAQAEFTHGVALLHSFWFEPAIASFQQAVQLDPTCAMGHWGVAMSKLGIPWSPTPEADLVDGQAAVAEALAVGGQTPREAAYIAAVAAFYQDAATLDHFTRALAYEAAMAQVAQAYPEDTEAQIFYALALLITAPPTDKSYTNQQQAQAILEPLFAHYPDHPGIAHYLIHTNDYPSLAAGGLDAANRYAAIAPAAPHVQHMPSHIFSRTGDWQASIDANRASVAAAKAALPADHPAGVAVEPELHAMDYMMYAHLQLAQDEAAKALLTEINALAQATGDFGSAYALAAIPARYALERGAWAEAAALTLPPATFAWERFPQAEAIVVFARGLGAARAGDATAARQALAELQALHTTLVEANNGYWAGQAVIQSKMVEAWIALVENQPESALALAQEAVALEDLTEKHPVTPGLVKPAYELLGELLLELDQPAAALQAFETLLVDDPHRFRGVYGAAQAAELAGDNAKAKSYYTALVDLAATADSERQEMVAAQAFLAQP
ncbi:MAG: hypothetical protein R3E79_10445 [Caldilineaceae bacterium]